MYDRMIKDHGYSVRKLAQKLGKDKGYLENRLRLADAPQEVRDLVSRAQRHPVPCLRADEDRRPAEAHAAWPTRSPAASCRLVKLREKIEGRPARVVPEDDGSERNPLRTRRRAGSHRCRPRQRATTPCSSRRRSSTTRSRA